MSRSIRNSIGLAIFALIAAIILFITIGRQHSQGQTPPVPQIIHLPVGDHLIGVSWACSTGGYCVPTWLTRPFRADEPLESYRLLNRDGYPTYIFYEHRAQ